MTEFFSVRNFDKIVIPEIQRDYVWRRPQIEALLQDLDDAYCQQQEFRLDTSSLQKNGTDDSIIGDFKKFYLRQRFAYNVGFVYAYQDDEYAGQLFLIDGQQRFTTIYLLLLALAIKDNKQDIFRKQFLSEDSTSRLDYRVRKASSDFLQRLVIYILEGHDTELSGIKQQFWFFTDYGNDRTIMGLIEGYQTIRTYLTDRSLRLDYNYLNEMVEFWYFDTNISEQGEELYIYMNSRGETVKENENLKAVFLAKLGDEVSKEEYGKKWEEWQDLFWENRVRTESTTADKGFNEFLRWLGILKAIANTPLNKDFYRDLLSGELPHELEEELSIEEIEIYISALKYLFAEWNTIVGNVQTLYGSDKIDNEDIIPRTWLRPPRSIDYPLDQINLFRLLPVLEFIKLHLKEGKSIDALAIYRLARYFYNLHRLDNVSKNVRDALVGAIEAVLLLYNSGQNDIVGLLNIEVSATILPLTERSKLALYRKMTNSDDRKRFEKSFWRAENFPYHSGDISFVLRIITDPLDLEKEMDPQRLVDFDRYEQLFEKMFRNADDKLIQAVLTFGEYGIHKGRTPSLQANRYCLGGSVAEWIANLRDANGAQRIHELLQYLIDSSMEHDPIQGYEDRINWYKHEVIAGNEERDWRYQLITNDAELEYCEKKLLCWTDDETIVYLLKSMKATKGNYRVLNI